MSGQASAIIAPRSPPSMPHSAPLSAVALRPALTAPARGAWLRAGRDGETPPSRTKKQTCSYGSAILQNLTHTTAQSSSLALLSICQVSANRDEIHGVIQLSAPPAEKMPVPN